MKKFDRATTIAKLNTISELSGNTKILLITESKVISQRQLNNIIESLQEGDKNITILYVVTTTRPQDYVKIPNSHSLSEILSKEEKFIFADVYCRNAGLSLNAKDSLISKDKVELFDFPILANEDFVSDHIQSYVNSWMAELSPNIREFCSYVAFSSYFSGGLFINEQLLKSIIGSSYGLSLIYTVKGKEKEALFRILSTDSNSEGAPIPFWKPRYAVFATCIINNVWDNWKGRVHEIGKNLINIVKQNGRIENEDMDLLYSIFIERRERDFRSNSFKPILQKFSTLIESIHDLERAEGVLEALKDAFPCDSYFAAHFARFLFEKASLYTTISPDDSSYIKAQENIDNALRLNDSSDDIYHIQGMFYRRRIASLRNAWKSNPKDYPLRDCEERLITWVNDALKSFDKSINLAATNAYGYVAKSQLIQETLEFEQTLHGLKKGDYSFIEEDEYLQDLVDELGTTLDHLNGICQQFRGNSREETPYSINETMSMYDECRLFYSSIIGVSERIIDKYRHKIKTASNDTISHYRKIFCDAIVLSKMQGGASERRAYGRLSLEELNELKSVLVDRRNSGDIMAYDKLFNLCLYRTEEYSVDDAIDLVRSWEAACLSSNVNGFTLLRARFLLASIYAAKAIIQELPNMELCGLSKKYFDLTREMANEFNSTPYGSKLSPIYYMGNETDIHVLLSKQEPLDDRRSISGRIIRIDKRNQGWIRLNCGLEVSFNAEGYDAQLDIDKEITGQLGFRYQGLGLYQFSRVEIDDHITILKEIETQDEEMGHAYDEQDTDDIYKTESEHEVLDQPKVIGHLSIDKSMHSSTQNNDREAEIEPVEGKTYHGLVDVNQKRVTLRGYKWKIVIDRSDGYFKDCTPNDYDYSENEEVLFEIKMGVHKNSGKPFPYAIGIRPTKEFDN